MDGQARRAGSPGWHKRATGIRILAFIETGITNARTEATNRMVKDARG
jgi:hypothetical protein